MIGLGGTVATSKKGVTGEVIVATSFEQLASLGDAVKGKIVLYDVRMPAFTEDKGSGYDEAVKYRYAGASMASLQGASAVLMRSLTARSLNTPHTGTMGYINKAPKIPAVAITVEDAELIVRLIAAGRSVTVNVRTSGRWLPDAPSANVIAEIRGRELPDEVVVMGGHFDSWDVGQGAHDNGAACVAAWHALTLVRRLGLQPRRTLRVVLWTNEENGGAGGRAYRAELGDDVASHVAAIEMDGGCERPTGFGFSLPDAKSDGSDERYERAHGKLREIAALLEAIDASTISRGGGGADIAPLMQDGVPGMSLNTVGEHYFDWHHTNADTLDHVDLQDFRRATALLGVMGYVLADMPGTLRGE
jgi:Zn-dependent M28 family amino/carboxypeptidase